MSVTQDTGSKVSPLMVIAAIVAVIAVAAALAWNFSRPQTPSTSDVANVVKEMQAPPGTPRVPPGQVAGEVMNRGGNKNTGK